MTIVGDTQGTITTIDTTTIEGTIFMTGRVDTSIEMETKFTTAGNNNPIKRAVIIHQLL